MGGSRLAVCARCTGQAFSPSSFQRSFLPKGGREEVWLAVDLCHGDPLLRLTVMFSEVNAAIVDAASRRNVLGRLLSRLRFSNDQRERVTKLVQAEPSGYEPNWSDGEVRRWILRVGPERLRDALEIERAKARASRGVSAGVLLDELANRATQLVESGLVLSPRDLAVDGRTLMRELSLAEGPTIGMVVAHLMDCVTEDPAGNDRSFLLGEAKRYLATKCREPACGFDSGVPEVPARLRSSADDGTVNDIE